MARASARHAAQRLRRASRGFTLIELTISLVAGLMVAMAVMGISKEATNSFHEEVRVSGAEMALRIAMERVRLDLQRAAYMGTGNLAGDPLVARRANYVGNTPNLSNFGPPLAAGGGAIPYSLQYLSGITLHPGGATVVTGADTVASGQLTQPPNNLLPDSIDIGGNMSTSDEYAAAVVWNPPAAGACSAGAALSIQMTTPAGWRIRNAETAAMAGLNYTPGLALQAAFHPGTSTTSSFLLKLTDQSGRSQYLVGCAGGAGVATTYNAAGAIPTAMVYLSPASAILNVSQTGGNGGVAGFAAGWVTVSPLEVARWDIMSPSELQTASPTAYASYVYNQTAIAGDPTNFALTRSYLDFSGACTSSAPCPIDPLTTEVVAEYAVDLKFGLTVDNFGACPTTVTANLSPPCPTIPPAYTNQSLVNLMMGGPALTGTTPSQFAAQTAVYAPNVGPQRIRDVQVRIGIRSPFGDRPVDLLPPPSSALAQGYLFRYLLTASPNPPHYQPATPYARVRESTTEVALPNQARLYF